MYGYVCFWNGKRIELYAETSYKAQQLAQEKFQATAGRKKVKGWDISVILAEKNGEEVTHAPMM